jgi:hypothetical protein
MASFRLGGRDGDSIVVAVGESRAKAPSHLTQDFLRFRDQLLPLYEKLNGEAVFSTLEQQLSIRVVGDGRGGMAVSGHALDRTGSGNRLAFEFFIDQTYLSQALTGLDQIAAWFPVRRG